MRPSEIFRKKHELWLSMLFGAFSVDNEEIYNILYDFSMIEFRHLKWFGQKLADENIEISFDREEMSYKAKSNFELLKQLIANIDMVKELYEDDADPLFKRFVTDENYFISKLYNLLKDERNDAKIRAFDKRRELEGFELDEIQTDALTLFLFEESYKEYELIMIYTYVNFYTKDKELSNIFIDLIDESFYHLKSFARMMAKMGILTMPRVIMERVYKFEDLEKFLLEGIEEEEKAKIECKKLSDAIKNDSLSRFFDFINYQENYHISLMKRALNKVRESSE